MNVNFPPLSEHFPERRRQTAETAERVARLAQTCARANAILDEMDALDLARTLECAKVLVAKLVAQLATEVTA